MSTSHARAQSHPIRRNSPHGAGPSLVDLPGLPPQDPTTHAGPCELRVARHVVLAGGYGVSRWPPERRPHESAGYVTDKRAQHGCGAAIAAVCGVPVMYGARTGCGRRRRRINPGGRPLEMPPKRDQPRVSSPLFCSRTLLTHINRHPHAGVRLNLPCKVLNRRAQRRCVAS